MKKIFSYNLDINKNAYVNWRMDRNDPVNNMVNIARGYMQASINLTEKILACNVNKEADIIIFPILFCVDHAIELYLKAIIWQINILVGRDEKYPKHHNLIDLYSALEQKMQEYNKVNPSSFSKDEFDEETISLKGYIDELANKLSTGENSKDVKMDFPRYPQDTKNNNHFYVEEYKNVTIDMENFLKRFTTISDILYGIACTYMYDY